MKKTLLIVLAVFYLAVSSGASVHFHYCMGELVSWGLTQQSGNTCKFCGMLKTESKKRSCCGDTEKQAKVEQSQKTNQIIYQFDQPSSAIIQPGPFVNYQVQIPVKITRETLTNAPPGIWQVPAFIKNCTYRI